MRRFRHQNRGFRMAVSTILMKRFYQHQPEQLAMGTGSRLKRAGVHPGDFRKDILHFVNYLKRPLRELRRRIWMEPGESRQACSIFM